MGPMTPTPDDVLRTFCTEVAAAGALWTMWSDKSIAVFSSEDGETAVPFWSTRERCAEFLSSQGKLESCSPIQIPWDLFRRVWVQSTIPPEADLGINWLGPGQKCWATREEVIAGVESAT